MGWDRKRIGKEDVFKTQDSAMFFVIISVLFYHSVLSRVQTGVNNVKRSGEGRRREGKRESERGSRGWHRARANEQLITNAFTPKRQRNDAPTHRRVKSRECVYPYWKANHKNVTFCSFFPILKSEIGIRYCRLHPAVFASRNSSIFVDESCNATL